LDALPISVVIPAHNRAHVIERAIESARRQVPLPPAEIIVVDDCSDDGTASVAEAARAVVIRHDNNTGPGTARNTGIEAAAYQWIAFLDSDDEWLPFHLETLWASRVGHVFVNGASVAVTEARLGRFNGNPYKSARVLNAPPDAFIPENLLNTSGMMADKSAIQKAGGFPPLRRVEDLDTWIRLLEQGTGVALPTVTHRYHVHNQQASSAAHRMRHSLLEVVGSYSDRSWFKPRLLRQVQATTDWDELRAALHDRSASWFPHAKPLLLNRHALGSLTRLMLHRRATRARSC